MKCVFLLFDSLNRHALSCYADDTIPTPNFARLAQRSTVFERHFVGSLPCMPARRDINSKLPYYFNRDHLEAGGTFPLAQCFDAARGFLDAHHAADDWFLHLECFDPHEPFFAPERFLADFPEALGGKIFDWPTYGHNDLDPALLRALRANYHALVTACDHYLGQLLDCFDKHDLWRDTWLVMSTDHGLLLGEKELLGKNRPPFYNEIAHIPLTIAAPRTSGLAPGRSQALTQAIDLMPTMLDIFGRAVPPEVTGRSLLPALAGRAVRESGCIFGQFGAAINYTDGRYAYFLIRVWPSRPTCSSTR